MNDSDRYRLLGTYRTPRFRYGDVAFCAVRGAVMLVGLSSGRIPWPVGQRGSARSLAVFGGLAEAVRRESAVAISHWWGVTAQTVTKWRRVLGVGPVTEGTHRLRSENALRPALVAGRDPDWPHPPDRLLPPASARRSGTTGR
jgi:hypothetical protein